MASDARKITIEILDGSGGSDKDKEKETKKSTKKIKQEIIKADTFKKVAKDVNNSVLSLAEGTVNRFFTLNEDYMAQDLYNNVKNSINKAKSLKGTAISIGKVAKTIGGVAGATAGVALGAATIVTEMVNYRQRMGSYYQALNATNYQTGFSATRAGLVNDSRGTEN